MERRPAFMKHWAAYLLLGSIEPALLKVATSGPVSNISFSVPARFLASGMPQRCG